MCNVCLYILFLFIHAQTVMSELLCAAVDEQY